MRTILSPCLFSVLLVFPVLAQNYPAQRIGLSQPAIAPMTVASDLNQDGFLDLLSPRYFGSSAGFSVALGDSEYQYTTIIGTTGPSTNGRCAAVADFTNDGVPDAVLVDMNTMLLYPGNGNGTFGSFIIYPIAPDQQPYWVELGDMDVDGLVDCVVADREGNNIAYFRNNGGGGFHPPTIAAAGIDPRMLVITDLNADGNPDCVTSNYESFFISVFINAGSGFFFASVPVALPQKTAAIAAADFNNDGNKDVAVIGANAINYGAVLPGNGAGGFGPASPLPITNGKYSITAADVNGDGRVDLITPNSTHCEVFRNLGGLAFSGSTIQSASGQHALYAELSGDGVGDLLISDSSLKLHIGTIGGPYISPKSYSSGGTECTACVTRDFNHDGLPDVAALNKNNICILPGSISGLGAATVATTFAGTPVPTTIVAGDWNLDGNEDIGFALAGTANIAHSMLGNGSGGFSAPVAVSGSVFASSIIAADMTADGVSDFACIGVHPNQAAILVGQGDGSFMPGATIGNIFMKRFSLGDLNGDGLLDLCGTTDSGGCVEYMNAGAGGLQFYKLQVIGGTVLHSVCVDVDQDGNVDLVGASGAGFLYIARNTGGGNLASTVNIPDWTKTSFVSAADVNADGIPEIIGTTSTANSNYVSIFKKNGPLSYGTPSAFASGYWPNGVAITDINADGLPDLVTPNKQDNSVTLLMNITNKFSSLTNYGTGTPGCFGRPGITGTSAPNVGNLQFALRCTNAPRNSLGLLLVTDLADITGNDPFSLGALFHVNIPGALELYTFDIVTDSAGLGVVPTSIPNNPTFSGKSYFGQILFIEAPIESCSLSLLGVVTSVGLSIAIP